jgi:hypothetical protein
MKNCVPHIAKKQLVSCTERARNEFVTLQTYKQQVNVQFTSNADLKIAKADNFASVFLSVV